MLKSAMDIKLISGSTVLINGKKEKILVNPEADNLAKNNCRIVVYNYPKYSELRTVGDKVSIMGPGEYEIGGVEIDGFNGGAGNTIYTVSVDGVSVGIVGKLKEELTEKKTGKISGVDVLIADIDNEGGIGPKTILKLAKSWGANYVVPVGKNEKGMIDFLNEADSEGLEAVESLKIDKDNLPDGTEIVLLKESR
jgi:hypothetical protein